MKINITNELRQVRASLNQARFQTDPKTPVNTHIKAAQAHLEIIIAHLEEREASAQAYVQAAGMAGAA